MNLSISRSNKIWKKNIAVSKNIFLLSNRIQYIYVHKKDRILNFIKSISRIKLKKKINKR